MSLPCSLLELSHSVRLGWEKVMPQEVEEDFLEDPSCLQDQEVWRPSLEELQEEADLEEGLEVEELQEEADLEEGLEVVELGLEEVVQELGEAQVLEKDQESPSRLRLPQSLRPQRKLLSKDQLRVP
eukprot:Blabericola_migrator_1__1791@NODE_1484_length_4445_cov_14_403381_g974_i0_p8_GENE_NODE_1484_length_4445_cov_14_403381_g974_i0NODE_1484_length_4445_cov_14_403381_g974_i0_p8_ORF_typecomplete_len127_score17_55AA_permease_N/PF08403_10/0_17ACTH_assoc/PF16102_5/3_8ACTH_assoc/PF16102_5/10_NODE_1484_length_4445_cov_14_403381_g974_i026683048